MWWHHGLRYRAIDQEGGKRAGRIGLSDRVSNAHTSLITESPQLSFPSMKLVSEWDGG